ncbi:MAG: mCpol domain-containing protein [Acidobacteriota bacterium]
MIYIALDGDDVGRHIEKFLIENKEQDVAELSEQITNTVQEITAYLRSIDFEVIFSAGDSILCKGGSIDIRKLSNYLAKTNKVCTFSVGIGNTLEKTYVALKYAKSRGKNTIVKYSENDQLEIIC